MVILSIRTDKPEAEIGVFSDTERLDYDTWYAHRELSMTIHQHIVTLLAKHAKTFSDVQGIVGFTGPGSFTGLRIGLTVANALADGLSIPIIGTQGEDWLADGVAQLKAGKNQQIILPEYGAPVHITIQRK